MHGALSLSEETAVGCKLAGRQGERCHVLLTS